MLCQLSYCPPEALHQMLLYAAPVRGRTKTMVICHQVKESTEDCNESRTALGLRRVTAAHPSTSKNLLSFGAGSEKVQAMTAMTRSFSLGRPSALCQQYVRRRGPASSYLP
jgi:hypothetical protein